LLYRLPLFGQRQLRQVNVLRDVEKTFDRIAEVYSIVAVVGARQTVEAM